MKTGKIIVIHENSTITVHSSKNPVTLELLQFHVGGYIECVPASIANDLLMVVNEEGKLQGRPMNAVATKLYNNPQDVIVGRAVLCLQDGEELRPFDQDTTLKLVDFLKQIGGAVI